MIDHTLFEEYFAAEELWLLVLQVALEFDLPAFVSQAFEFNYLTFFIVSGFLIRFIEFIIRGWKSSFSE
jgi:hypothetical protein